MSLHGAPRRARDRVRHLAHNDRDPGRVRPRQRLPASSPACVPNLLLLFKDLVRDDASRMSAKVWLGLAAIWLASPIDLIPEFVPVLGPLDDAVVAAVALRYLMRKAGSEIVYEHWRGERATISRVIRLFGAEPVR